MGCKFCFGREYPRIQLARAALVRSTNTAVVHLEQSLLSLWYQGLLLTPTFSLYEEILNLILNASSIVCKFVVVFSFLMCDPYYCVCNGLSVLCQGRGTAHK
jgi:hypothetical protein